jgi:LysM repeat protein
MRFRRFLTGLGALAVLIGLLAGAPIALAVFAGNPLPDHVPALSEVTDTLTSRDDGQLFLRALAIVGWLGWATFVLSVLVEIPARAFRIPVPRLPGMRRQQRMAAALVGGVALIIGASPAVASAATLAQGPYAATSYAPTSYSAPAPAAMVQQPVAVQRDIVEPRYRVEKGDYLGHIADRYLGEFDRYAELAKLNKIRDPDLIRPGQMLRMPEGAADTGVRTHATGLVSMPTPPPPAPAKAPVEEEPAVPDVPPPPTVQEEALAHPDGSGGAGTLARPAQQREGINLPLAVTAVLTAASVIGAQIGGLLGLRDRRRRSR